VWKRGSVIMSQTIDLSLFCQIYKKFSNVAY
jgi:hypothetical protein